MSGFSTNTECPNCGSNKCNYWTDRKPFDMAGYDCPDCGLTISPYIQYRSLDELNEYRQELTNYDDDDNEIPFPILTKLPKQNML
jgi:hypothetical protein